MLGEGGLGEGVLGERGLDEGVLGEGGLGQGGIDYITALSSVSARALRQRRWRRWRRWRRRRRRQDNNPLFRRVPQQHQSDGLTQSTVGGSLLDRRVAAACGAGSERRQTVM